jgi:hypothetical protein
VSKALHLPFSEGKAQQVGKHLFRKQLLPLSTVEHEGERLDFNQEYLSKLVANFAAGKLDQVPYVLVDSENKHVDDPEKYRGEVKAMDLAGDGLYITLELSEDGAKLVDDNPKLGVSARIDCTDPEAPFIEHVAGTLNPVIKGMKPWEKVALSDAAKSAGVIDLSGESFSDPVSGLSDTEKATFQALAKKGGKEAAAALKDADISDEEMEQALARILEEEGKETEPGKVKEEPVPATLSKEDREAIELAKSDAKTAREQAAAARAELAKERYEAKRDKLLEAGVPPAIVDLAEPVLKGEKAQIELSNGTKIDAHDTVGKILEQCEGMIDLSERGRSDGEASNGNEELLDSWERDDPQGSRRAREKEKTAK